ncbi:MAG: dihydrofolate reductase [Nonomuraea sp.]|nr:dihydrofolate reductase [Nonomuraea sp.]
MSKVTCDMSATLDGYVTGLNQTLERPFGDGVGERLHEWMFEEPEKHTEVLEAITAAGAFIMGRNMFGPSRGEHDLEWTGWWGEEPPYHAPVFVLTHHPRESVTMKGGTTFHFVTDGIEAAMALAREAAGDEDVSIAGGAATVNQYLAAGLIDELRMHVVPLILGRGERLFEGVPEIGLEQVGAAWGTARVTHLTYRIIR